jgi:MoaA/NifB/PqqE/SkfB family radical SAM enzyme
MPVDIQIDLGNICNSACIMCRPDQSSKLAVDYAKLNAIEPTMFAAPERYRSWTQDPVILDSVVEQLAAIPNIRYLHFLGGETLYDPAFHQICERLIASGLATDIIVGTTTNGTIYDERIERYIRSFKEFHLGISIETVTTLNDYVRWPSRIEDILANIKKFNSLRGETGLYNSLRITPNVLTISQFDSMARFMLDNDIAAESCNILHRPAMLRMELMPEDIRQETIAKLRGIVEEHDLNKSQLINFRSNSHIRQAISNVIIEYITFLENYRVPEDADKHRTDLVRFLKAFEKLRGNSILDHAPRYEQFLRHHGY